MKQFIQSILGKFGYRITKIREHKEYPNIDILDLVIGDYLKRLDEEFYFIQIGAHDGKWCDPINNYVKRFHWNGLLVEPQPRAFQKLVENYSDQPQLKFENALIFNENRAEVPLYTVHNEGDNDALFQLSYMARLDRDSLFRELSSFGLEEVNSLIEEIRVPSLTIPNLLEKHNFPKLDLLVIDAEGYDFEILKMFDFSKIKPAIIQLEIAHLSIDEKNECFSYLAQNGYRISTVVFDAIGYLQVGGELENPGLGIVELLGRL